MNPCDGKRPPKVREKRLQAQHQVAKIRQREEGDAKLLEEARADYARFDVEHPPYPESKLWKRAEWNARKGMHQLMTEEDLAAWNWWRGFHDRLQREKQERREAMHKRIEAQNALDRRKEEEREKLKVEKAARKVPLG